MFRIGELELNDSSHSGLPEAIDEVYLLEEDTRQLSRYIANKLGHSQSTVIRALRLGRTSECLSNLSTVDEKWTLYVNYHHELQWLKVGDSGASTPKGELHPKKWLLCIWWNVERPFHWELLRTNTTVTADQ
uniref:Uncharacterized protein n=1 Tax=Caenorhabditis japonica TaxID=281687 RepID=A0A8R1IQ10_CAEJA